MTMPFNSGSSSLFRAAEDLSRLGYFSTNNSLAITSQCNVFLWERCWVVDFPSLVDSSYKGDIWIKNFLVVVHLDEFE